MTEAALALSEQKVSNLGDLLTKTSAERTELIDRQSRELKKQQEVLHLVFFFYMMHLVIS